VISPPDESGAEPSRGGSRRRNLRIAAGLVGIYALLLLADAVLPAMGERPQIVAAIRPQARFDNIPLWTAYTHCGAGKISGRGVSLSLDTAGDRSGLSRWYRHTPCPAHGWYQKGSWL